MTSAIDCLDGVTMQSEWRENSRKILKANVGFDPREHADHAGLRRYLAVDATLTTSSRMPGS